LSADGSRIAFFELTDVRDKEFDDVRCPMPPLTPLKDTIATNSILQQAVLRIRKVNSNSVADDGQLVVNFAGRTITDVGRITNVAYPFQRLFEGEGVPFFRASWSPDGTRVVYSDGTLVRIWTVGNANSVAIVGTDEGILPAWSPDGSWIAFSKPFKGATQSITCFGERNGASLPAAIFARTIYTPLTRENAQLFVVHPDGTGLKPLGEGEGATWTSDSKTIVAHRANNLYRIALDTGAATLVPATLNAFEPALSHDGTRMAFARRTEVGNGAGELNSKGQYNLWVAPF
jgi:Tol biopolymer transport system component